METQNQTNIKLQTYIRFKSFEDCKEIYKKQGREITETQICAGGEEGEEKGEKIVFYHLIKV